MKKLLSIIPLLCLLQVQVKGSCPPMFYRNQWNASQPLNVVPMGPSPVPNVVVHHSATRSCESVPDCIAIIKSFQNGHINDRGWDDIAYSFLIGGDGNVYEGRGWGVQVQGTQPPEWNYLGYTFCIIGSFDENLPSYQQLDLVKQLIACAAEENYTAGNYSLRGHRDVYTDTACPGEALYTEIQTWPRYNASSIQ